MLCLTNSHLIILDKDQCPSLTNSEDVEIGVIGISVPVWCKPVKRKKQVSLKTSEPANEIFCKYVVTNKNKKSVVEPFHEGYTIHIPTQEMVSRLINEGVITFRNYDEIKIKKSTYRVVNFVVIRTSI